MRAFLGIARERAERSLAARASFAAAPGANSDLQRVQLTISDQEASGVL